MRTRLLLAAAAATVAMTACSSSEIRPPSIEEDSVPAGAIDGRIVVTTRGDVEYQLAAVDAEREALEDIAGSEGVRSPAYSPDGTQVAAALNEDGRGAIQLFTRGRPRTLVADEGYFDHPSWSPDGSQIAYAFHAEGRTWDIYVVDVDSGVEEAVVTGDAQDWYPSWSPVDDHIAFTSDRDGDNAIWLADLDAGQLRKLVDSEGEDLEPSWSPNGTTIVFSSDRELETWQIFTVPAAGGVDARLVRSETVDRYPVYSPDGRFLLVSTGYLAIYAADGGELPDGADRWKVVDELTLGATWTNR